MKHIPFEGINTICDACNTQESGYRNGYIVGMRAYCMACYKKKFPKFDERVLDAA